MLKGNGVSTGIGFGKVVVLKKTERKIEKKNIQKEQVEQELKRVHEALSNRRNRKSNKKYFWDRSRDYAGIPYDTSRSIINC